MQIGALARQTGCPIQTIRFYEQEGLLPPPSRSAGNFRLYGDAHVERLLFIRRCRSLPDGHPKLLHCWPVKLLQAGRGDYAGSGVMASRAAASLSR